MMSYSSCYFAISGRDQPADRLRIKSRQKASASSLDVFHGLVILSIHQHPQVVFILVIILPLVPGRILSRVAFAINRTGFAFPLA